MRKSLSAVAALGLLLCAPLSVAATGGGPVLEGGLDWQAWKAGNEIDNVASLQRGARNFMGYCSGCHSLKYVRYSRMAEDLKIPEAQLEESLILPGSKKSDYITSSLNPADGETWFGKAPPDLSLMARARGTDYLYQFLKTFYANPKAATGVDNLSLPGTAMPHVLSELQGVQTGVFKDHEVKDAEGKTQTQKVFFNFEPGVPGSLSPAEYDEFVRDTVNFLDYAGEPAQLKRRGLGVWVVLFLLLFTGIAYLLKAEYWKDVK